MSTSRHPFVTFSALTALFILGAWLATWFVHGPDQVTLIWPPAGVSIGALILFGRRWWPFIPIAVAVFHLSLGPVPLAFIPFSALANLLTGWLAAYWIQRRAPQASEQFNMRAGFEFLSASLVTVAIGSLVGAAGLVFAGMVPASDYADAAWRWLLGDMFGVVTVLPSVLIGFRWKGWRFSGPLPFRYASRLEKGIWLIAFVASLGSVAWVARYSGAYALGLAALPFVFVIWSAVRFEPPWTAYGTMVIGLYMATLLGLGYAGLSPPRDLVSTTILIAFLTMITAAPHVVSAAAHENRATSLRAMRRASIDPLTGLANRPAFEDGVKEAIRRNPDESMAFAYLDIDQFKHVNDTLSHGTGDELLRSLTGALSSVVSGHDLLARLGGDEFALLMRRVDADAALELAQGLRRIVADFRFAHGERLIAPTVSIGLVTFRARDASFSTLLAKADAACYAAKELGGNRVQLVADDSSATNERDNAMDWAMRIGDAIEHGRLKLYAQSIAALKPGPMQHLRHFEILLRIEDPQSGNLLEPGPYIAAAERFRFANRIDRAVVSNALDWFDRNPEHAAQVGMIGINLSGASVGDDDFAQFIESRIAQSRIDPGRLWFEITETCAVRELAQAQRFIRRIRALGCKFALDDFGAGFCSFSYLHSLDVDFFKIDGSFVREIQTSPLALAIVRSIAEIARVMRKQTIAEYTESDAIRRQLFALGVDYAQGFAIDRPAPLESIFMPPDPVQVLRRAS